MRVAVTVDPYLPVPPDRYGGIERVVDFLVRELVRRGHEVTLVAHPESRCPAGRLVGYGFPPHFTRRARWAELRQVGRFLRKEREGLDLVHSFGRLAALLPVLACRGLPKIQSYQRERVPWRSVRIASWLAGRSLRFTGCSTSVYAGGPGRRPPAGRWHTVFNGVDTDLYRPVARVPADAPLVFLGRLEPVKGPHQAIAIARRAGRRLVLAGNRVEEGSARGFFEKEIAPHLDGAAIRWAGPVDDGQKGALLGEAAALLFPVEWEEPFGIVMAEAMACGTPVVAFRRGSVPEVVRDGVNGFACDTVEEAAVCVERAARLDRARVREDCERRFGHRAIVDAYEALYREMLADCRRAG